MCSVLKVICHDADSIMNLCVILLPFVVVVVVSLSARLDRRLRVPDVVDVGDADCLHLFDVVQSPPLRQKKLALDDGAPRPRRRLIGRFVGDAAFNLDLPRLYLIRPVCQLADEPLHTVRVALAMVEVVEVGNDHRNRKRYCENAGDSTQRPDQLSPDADRHHIAVTDRRHRHHGPPERVWNAMKLRVGGIGLGEVDGAGEQHDADQQKEDEQAELAHAGADRLTEDLETLRVARQLEDAEDADEPNDAKDGERHRVRAAAAVCAGERRGKGDEVRKNGDQVDHIHNITSERQSAWRCREAQQ